MGRPGPLVAIVLALAAAGGAVAVVLHVPPALPTEPLAHARAPDGESAAEGPAAAVDVESPSRTLEPTPAPAEIDPGELGEADEPALALDFTPNRAQVDQLRRMSEEEREAFARQLSFGIGTKELKDGRLRALVERQMARSEKEQKAALDRMYAAGDVARLLGERRRHGTAPRRLEEGPPRHDRALEPQDARRHDRRRRGARGRFTRARPRLRRLRAHPRPPPRHGARALRARPRHGALRQPARITSHPGSRVGTARRALLAERCRPRR